MFSEEKRAAIAEAYRRGDKVLAIAEEYGCNVSTPSVIARSFGIASRTIRVMNNEDRNQCIAADYAAGMPLADIEHKYGMQPSNVYRIIKKLGVAANRQKRSRD